MNRKFASVLLVLCILFNSVSFSAYAEDVPFYRLVAEDSFLRTEYSGSAWGDKSINEVYATNEDGSAVIVGDGFVSNWLEKNSDGEFVAPDNANTNISLYNIGNSSGKPAVRVGDTATEIARKLESPLVIDDSTCGEFVLSATVRTTQSVAGSDRAPFSYKLGEAIEFGYKWNSAYDTMLPYAKIGGTEVIATQGTQLTAMTASDIVNITAVVSLNRIGEDTISVTVEYRDATSTINGTGNISGDVEYISFDVKNVLIRAIKAEFSSQALYDNIISIITNGPEDRAELKQAFKDMAYYNGNDKSNIIDSLRGYAVGELEGADKAELLSVSPDLTNPLGVSDAQRIELEYDFKLDDSAEFQIYDVTYNREHTGTSSYVNGNKVVITSTNPLVQCTEYKIKCLGTDFKGDPIDDISFRTSTLPEINITDGGVYPEYTTVTWQGDSTVAATIKLPSGIEKTMNNGTMLVTAGEYVITINSSKNGLSDTAVYNITVESVLTDEVPFYRPIAQDTFLRDEYSGSAWGGQINSVYAPNVIAGSGFVSNWLEKKSEGKFEIPSSENTNITLYNIEDSSAKPAIRVGSTATEIARKLESPFVIDDLTCGEFVLSATVRTTQSVAESGRAPFSYKLGEAIEFGYKWNSAYDTMLPYAKIRGTEVVATQGTQIAAMTTSDIVNVKAVVNLNRTGQDTITVTVEYRGVTSSINGTGDILSDVEYISFDVKNVLIRAIKAEFSSQALYDNIKSIITNGPEDKAELKQAFKDMTDYNGNDKANIINALKIHATGELEGADKVELLSASPEMTNLLKVSEVEKFELEYDFELDSSAEFQIYNVTDDTVHSGTLSEVKENKAAITLTTPLVSSTEYKIKCLGTDFKGDSIPEISFRTSAIPDINVADGGHYSEQSKIIWTANGAEITVVLKDSQQNEQTISNEYTVMTPGEYVLKIEASKNGFTDNAVMNITFDEDTAPVVSNVRIEGNAETEAVLNARYDFYDANNDAEGAHNIEWYKITPDGDIKVGDGLTYTLQQADENCDLYLKFQPVALSTVNSTGEWVTGETFKGAYKPTVSDVKVSGVVKANEYLTPAFQYNDINGDEAGIHIIKWYIENGDSDIEITENIEDRKLKITENLFNKNVYMTVTPVSAQKPYNGDTVTTELIIMPSNPVVSDVRIEGTPMIGETLTAYYKFSDPNLDLEGNSVYEWKNEHGNIVGTKRTLEITSSMMGYTLTVTVKGVSEEIPTDSAPVTSASVTIPSVSIGGGGGVGSSGGGGSSLGYSGTISGSTTQSQPVTPDTPSQPETTETPTQSGSFKDLETHWSKEYVGTLVEKGIVVKDETFRPDDSITRAEVLAMLFRSEGAELSKYGDSYDDVKSDDWYADYIQTALDRGIISSADNFRPNDSITREETAKMIALMLNLKSEKQAEFADFDLLSDWAAEYVNAVCEAGIFKGDDNKNFNGKSSLTRAETATVIHRLLSENAFGKAGVK